MKITSNSFQNGATIPMKHSCDAQGTSPPLDFNEVPKNAQSLALIVDDPDAPGGTWDHWILYNIPPQAKGVTEGEEPLWPHCKNSWNRNNWGAPCPPDREHRYFFKLYALNAKLPVAKDKKSLLEAMNGHVIAQAELMGKYKRK